MHRTITDAVAVETTSLIATDTPALTAPSACRPRLVALLLKVLVFSAAIVASSAVTDRACREIGRRSGAGLFVRKGDGCPVIHPWARS